MRISSWGRYRCFLMSAGLLVTTLSGMAAFAAETGSLTDSAKNAKFDLKKTDRFYADPSAPNIAGTWFVEPDNYRPGRVSPTATEAPAGGLPPGVLPRKHWIVDGKPLPGRLATGPWLGIPYTPEWQKAYAARVASNTAGKTYGDPNLECLPRGAMAVYNHAASTGFALTQTPGRVQQIFEEQGPARNIYTDGRKHPASADVNSDDYDPTPDGHSIGHWEGKTLVVDTIGVAKEHTMGYYAPHSDVFHVVERFTRLDNTHLDLDITVDDQKALLKPMSMKIRYVLQPGLDLVPEICDSYRNSTDAEGFMQTLTKGKRRAGWDLPE